MAINKVIVNGETKLDLTADTVTINDVKNGVTFHDASGVKCTGNAFLGGVEGVRILKKDITNYDDGWYLFNVHYSNGSTVRSSAVLITTESDGSVYTNQNYGIGDINHNYRKSSNETSLYIIIFDDISENLYLTLEWDSGMNDSGC